MYVQDVTAGDGGGGGRVTAAQLTGVRELQEAVLVFVFVLVTVVADVKQHSAGLLLTTNPDDASNAVKLVVMPLGNVPVSELNARLMELSVLSWFSAHGTVPRSELLLSTSESSPPNRLDVSSLHVTPTQLRPYPGCAVLWPGYEVTGVRVLRYGTHGCRCVLPQLAASAEVLVGSSASCASRRMSAIGLSRPMDVPYSTPLPYAGVPPLAPAEFAAV